MINKLLPHAAHLLVALKKTIPAVLLLGTLSLVSAPTARAQILFSVDAFTTDLLTITLLPGTLDTTTVAETDWGMTITGGAGDWLKSTPTPTLEGVGHWGETPFASASSNAAYNLLVMYWGDPLNGENGGILVNPITLTFAGTGAFQPSEIFDGFTLTWGSPFGTQAHTVQSFVSWPIVGGAVPEPSSLALIAGLAMLGLAGTRRRRTAEANA
jgi:hypothetical protein